MIKVKKEYDGVWTVYDTKTKKTATIVKFKDGMPWEKKYSFYRVDVNGQTVASMIDHFQKAKGVASKYLGGV